MPQHIGLYSFILLCHCVYVQQALVILVYRLYLLIQFVLEVISIVFGRILTHIEQAVGRESWVTHGDMDHEVQYYES